MTQCDMRKMLVFLSVLTLLFCGCSDRPYVIVQIADAQLGFSAADESQRTGAEYVNDLTYETECLMRAVALVNRMKPDAVVFTGDQVNMPANGEQWSTFERIVSGIDDAVSVLHIPGNHDVHMDDTGVDTSPFTCRYGEDRFIHSENGVNLIGINTNLIKSNDIREADQLSWLKSVLMPEMRDEVTILFGHHPFFMTDIDEEDSYFPIMRAKRKPYFDLFSSLGIDAVYAGHRHESFAGEYNGIPMKTTTSVAFQIGDSNPSVRIITVRNGLISDELVEI